jgi:shikimate kinase
MPIVTLVGYRGTGKSTVARLLAARLAVPWVDADAVVEERLGCTIAEVVRDRGEAVFRDAEAEVLASLLATFPGIVSTGGGVVVRAGNRRLLAEHGRPIVWLTAPVATIRSRLAADPGTFDRRPALQGDDALAEVEAVLLQREPLYRECADWTLDTSVQAPEVVAERIAEWLDGRKGAARHGRSSC